MYHCHGCRGATVAPDTRRKDDITNGGKITAHDFHGKRKMIHALDKPPCYPYIVRVVPARGI